MAKKAKRRKKKTAKKNKKIKAVKRKQPRIKKKPAHVVIVEKIRRRLEESAARPDAVVAINSLCEVLTAMIIPEGESKWITGELIEMLTGEEDVQNEAGIRILLAIKKLQDEAN